MKFRKEVLLVLTILFLSVNAYLAQPQSDLVDIKLNKSNIKTDPGKELVIELSAIIKEGYHVNSNKPNDQFLIPVSVTSNNESFPIKKIEYPEPKKLKLPISSDPVSAFAGEIKIVLKFYVDKNTETGVYKIPIQFSYQACNDETCFPPSSVTKIFLLEISRRESVTSEEKMGSKQSVNENKPSVQATKTANDSLQSKTDSGSKSNFISKAAIEEKGSLIIALVFAFLGGIILNLMPCVLPVLSLKIMGFIKQAGENKDNTRKHGLAFTLGVLVSFWILAGLLIALRAGGQYLGWGFQLQSPAFVSVLSILLFLFALSMFGVFEIGVTLTSLGRGNSKSSGYSASFSSGVLATIVATPCTAPFMGSALGFALSQPAFVSLLIFTSLGLGMALPYVILTSTPSLLKFVPKPGAWMESFKQFMGFLLMATVLWLIWVLSLQTGADGVVFLLASLIIVSISGWIYGRWANITKSTLIRRIAQTASIMFLACGIIFSLHNIEAKKNDAFDLHKQEKIDWVKYNPDLLNLLRKEGKPVFVDFTAAWCLSCQVNEKVAFGSARVQNAFVEKGITALKADWTNKDEIVTKALAEFGRNSVPLYVLYSPGKEPVILPEILTPGIVSEKLNAIPN